MSDPIVHSTIPVVVGDGCNVHPTEPSSSSYGPVKKKQKTGHKTTEDFSDLRNQAKSLCKNAAEYKQVCGFKNKEKLQEWIDVKTFESDAAIQSSFSDSIMHFYATACDMAVRGNEYVYESVFNDQSIKDSLTSELGGIVKYFFNNKVKLGLHTTAATMRGKKKQYLLEKPDGPGPTVSEFVEPPVVEQQYQATTSDQTGDPEENNETAQVVDLS
jgi:hypothetical protein